MLAAPCELRDEHWDMSAIVSIDVAKFLLQPSFLDNRPHNEICARKDGQQQPFDCHDRVESQEKYAQGVQWVAYLRVTAAGA